MAETKRPDPPGYDPAPGHVWAPIPETSSDWKLQAGRACRALASHRRRACGAPSVAALNRRRHRLRSAGYADSWWTYCVVPETPVLTAELRWVPAGDLLVGQELITVDEEPTGNPDRGSPMMRSNRNRFYRRGQVLAAPRRLAECVRLTMEDGRQVVSAADHRWLAWHPYLPGAAYYRQLALAGVVRCGYSWVPAQQIYPGMEIASPLRVWPEETSFMAGWMSGLFDGEGWLTRHGATGTQVGLAQNAGPVPDEALKYLDNIGVPYSIRERGYDECVRVAIGARWAAMELMGRLRPVRLMPRAAQLWEGWRIIRNGPNRSPVVATEPAGLQEVVSLETSTRTYLADGLVAHNCAEHLYGRWVEDGVLMRWAAVPEHGGDR